MDLTKVFILCQLMIYKTWPNWLSKSFLGEKKWQLGLEVISHTLKWRTTEKRGHYSPYVCIHMYIYIYTCMCISTKYVSPRIVDMFTRLTNHQRNSLQSLWPAIIYGYCRNFLLLRYDVGKTIINHPPNHPNHHFYRLYKPFPVMGGLSLFYPHYTRIMFHFHDRNAILDPASQICGSPSLNGYTCLVG